MPCLRPWTRSCSITLYVLSRQFTREIESNKSPFLSCAVAIPGPRPEVVPGCDGGSPVAPDSRLICVVAFVWWASVSTDTPVSPPSPPVCPNGSRTAALVWLVDLLGRFWTDTHTSALMFGTSTSGAALLRRDHRCGPLSVPAWAAASLQRVQDRVGVHLPGRLVSARPFSCCPGDPETASLCERQCGGDLSQR